MQLIEITGKYNFGVFVIFTTCFVLGCFEDSLSQTITYRVTWRGDSIGYMIAQRESEPEFESYSLIAESKISVLFDFKMKTTYDTDYYQGSLKSAKTKSMLNQKERFYSSIEKAPEGYTIETKKGKSKFDGEIKESIVSMYFKEPHKGTIFSERFGEMCPIKKVEKGKYRLSKPDGRTNMYFFKDGICYGGEINLSLATIIFEKID